MPVALPLGADRVRGAHRMADSFSRNEPSPSPPGKGAGLREYFIELDAWKDDWRNPFEPRAGRVAGGPSGPRGGRAPPTSGDQPARMADQGDLDEARRHFEQGYAAQMQNRLEEAIACYRRSIEVRPTAEAHTFLGWVYSFQGRHDDAIAQCKMAIEVDPDFGNPYNDIGVYLIELGQAGGRHPLARAREGGAALRAAALPVLQSGARVRTTGPRPGGDPRAPRGHRDRAGLHPRPSRAASPPRHAQLTGLPFPFYDNPLLFGHDRSRGLIAFRARDDAVRVWARVGGTTATSDHPLRPFLLLADPDLLRGFRGERRAPAPRGPWQVSLAGRDRFVAAGTPGPGPLPAGLGPGGRARPTHPTGSSPTPSISFSSGRAARRSGTSPSVTSGAWRSTSRSSPPRGSSSPTRLASRTASSPSPWPGATASPPCCQERSAPRPSCSPSAGGSCGSATRTSSRATTSSASTSSTSRREPAGTGWPSTGGGTAPPCAAPRPDAGGRAHHRLPALRGGRAAHRGHLDPGPALRRRRARPRVLWSEGRRAALRGGRARPHLRGARGDPAAVRHRSRPAHGLCPGRRPRDPGRVRPPVPGIFRPGPGPVRSTTSRSCCGATPPRSTRSSCASTCAAATPSPPRAPGARWPGATPPCTSAGSPATCSTPT